MTELFLTAVLLGIPLVPMAAGTVLLRRTRAGSIGRGRGIGLYAAIAISPTVLFAAGLLTTVGIETWTDRALIREEMARSALLVVGFGLAVWLVSLIVYVIAVFRGVHPSPRRPL